jgi:hypothetical protein
MTTTLNVGGAAAIAGISVPSRHKLATNSAAEHVTARRRRPTHTWRFVQPRRTRFNFIPDLRFVEASSCEHVVSMHIPEGSAQRQPAGNAVH